jgi:predicted RNA binding protein YcfA (HicA-like mRNA interferase family)
LPKLPVFSGREAIAALKRGGFIIRTQNATHVTMVHPQTKCRTVVPDTPDDLPVGTRRAIIRQAGLTVEEFIELLK